MRFLFGIIIFASIFTANLFAQNSLAVRNFETANQFAKKGNIEKAIEHFEISLQIAEAGRIGKPAAIESKIHYNLGVCFLRKGEFAVAENEFSKSLILDSKENPQTLYGLALSRMYQRKTEKASAL